MLEPTLLYVTSFNKEIYHASGKKLIGSFIKTNPQAKLLCCHEKCENEEFDLWLKVYYKEITNNRFLREWEEDNKDIISERFGGNAPHVEGKQGWWNSNVSRWFRKAVSLDVALDYYDHYDYFVWLDSDCIFQQPTPNKLIADLVGQNDMAYFKGQKRGHPDAGILIFNLKADGDEFLYHFIRMYRTGKFRDCKRWDDAWIFWQLIESKKYKTIDLSEHQKESDVIPVSIIAPYITHHKGTHGRIMGIYK